MAVKLHRCSWMWLKMGGHPCWRVQQALDEADVDYEVVTGPAFPRGRRKEVERVSGQTKFPAIEFEDGSGYRDESARMVEEIKAGKLFEHARSAPGSSSSA